MMTSISFFCEYVLDNTSRNHSFFFKFQVVLSSHFCFKNIVYNSLKECEQKTKQKKRIQRKLDNQKSGFL